MTEYLDRLTRLRDTITYFYLHSTDDQAISLATSLTRRDLEILSILLTRELEDNFGIRTQESYQNTSTEEKSEKSDS